MTAVVIAPRREDPTNDTEVVVSGGWFQIRPSMAYVAGGQWVQPVWSNPVQLTGSPVTVQLDPLVDIPYELYMELPNGRVGPKLVVNEFRFVTGSGPVGWETLTQVAGPSGGPVLGGALEARVTVLESEIGTVSGGASSLAAVSGISTDAKTLIATPNSFSTMRGLLSAAPTASPTFTTSLTAANPTFTGTVTIPDNALAIADTAGLQTALDAKAPLASPAFTGNPTAPTPTAGDNDTSIATTGFVTTAVAAVTGGGGAPLASPAFTGTPTAPTAAPGTNTTQLATTGFVSAAIGTVPAQSAIDDLNTLVTSLTLRVQELEENGGNLSAIAGAASARNNPLTGGVLNTGTVVVWLVDGTAPTNAVTGDIILNRVTV